MNRATRRRITKLVLVVFLAMCAVSVPMLSQRAIRKEHERHSRVIADIRTLGTQLDHYKSLNGAYPTTAQGLAALVAAPKDPWLSDYVYRCPGIHNRDDYDAFSAGPDREPDTADDDWGE
jgi:general secretion pathway protein G